MGRDGSLTRKRILRAALRIVDRRGLEGLTMRRVAESLGAGTMSLYHHVSGKDDLVQGVLELVIDRVELPPPDLEGWQERIHHILRSFRRAVLRHPGVLPVVATRQLTTPHSLRVVEEGLDSLRRGGFGEAAAVHAYRAVASYAVGFLSLEVGGVFRMRDNPVLPGLIENPPADLPRLAEVAPHLLEWDPDREFDVGLHAILSGLDRRPSRPARSPGSRSPRPERRSRSG